MLLFTLCRLPVPKVTSRTDHTSLQSHYGPCSSESDLATDFTLDKFGNVSLRLLAFALESSLDRIRARGIGQRSGFLVRNRPEGRRNGFKE